MGKGDISWDIKRDGEEFSLDQVEGSVKTVETFSIQPGRMKKISGMVI